MYFVAMSKNYQYWFLSPFSWKQLASWLLLLISIYLVLSGIFLLKKSGNKSPQRIGDKLFDFEKTTQLIELGIYKYIRHPMYSSLIFLTWGIFLKNTTLELFIVSMFSTVFIYFTAKYDEKECIDYFGVKYTDYSKRSKMFIPFIF